jgi:uncharacterized membrane protein YfcA
MLERLCGLVLLLMAVCVLVCQCLQHARPWWLPHSRLRHLRQAQGTLHVTLALLALTGLLVHGVMGTWDQGLRRIMVLGISMGCGVQLGGRFSSYLHGAGIVRHVAIALGSVGIWLLMRAHS